MALSRIWSAFIIIAILVAAIKFTFQPGQQKIFSQLVTGKNTDTVSTRLVDSASLPVYVTSQLLYEKTAVWDKERVVKEGTAYKAFRYCQQMVSLIHVKELLIFVSGLLASWLCLWDS